ncbi:MAG: NAD(P)/FAD-dependent oxidoreductase, partial [Candidatus Poseidoniales archaeon]
MTEQRVAIVGAGVAGLHCASILLENGIEVLIFDQEREVGGRMKTTRKDGFLLDHGFHVLQTAYPT